MALASFLPRRRRRRLLLPPLSAARRRSEATAPGEGTRKYRHIVVHAYSPTNDTRYACSIRYANSRTDLPRGRGKPDSMRLAECEVQAGFFVVNRGYGERVQLGRGRDATEWQANQKWRTANYERPQIGCAVVLAN